MVTSIQMTAENNILSSESSIRLKKTTLLIVAIISSIIFLLLFLVSTFGSQFSETIGNSLLNDIIITSVLPARVCRRAGQLP